jgi:glucokinase
MIAAIDIGGTKIALGIVDHQGKVLVKKTMPTQAGSGAQDAVQRMVALLKACMEEVRQPIEGIGIGCTGPVYPQLGTIGKLVFLPGWEGFNLVKAVEDEFGIGAALENDADAAALGEWVWGCGKGKKLFMLVTVGTGIGVGLVVEGKLYRGVNGTHPEIGHHFIDPAGPSCSCGGKGCWESLASGPAMEKWAQIHHPQEKYFTAKELCQMADTGVVLACSAIERTAHYLGVGIANLVTLFTPEMIALTGGLISSQHLFLPIIKDTVQHLCWYVPFEQVQIIAVPPNVDAGLRGAAQVWVCHQA